MESRLGKSPTTDEPETPTDPAMPRWLSCKGRHLPEKLSTLRQKLYQKAKQEPITKPLRGFDLD